MKYFYLTNKLYRKKTQEVFNNVLNVNTICMYKETKLIKMVIIGQIIEEESLVDLLLFISYLQTFKKVFLKLNHILFRGALRAFIGACAVSGTLLPRAAFMMIFGFETFFNGIAFLLITLFLQNSQEKL